jgi:hypothetical protein
MTAQIVIDQIKALPPDELAKVVVFLHELEAVDHAGPRSAGEDEFAQAAQWTFQEHADLLRKLSQ